MPTIIKLIGRCKKSSTLKPIHILSLIVFSIILTVCTSVSIAQQLDYTPEEIAKLDSYAQIIGQAGACNIEYEDEFNKIFDWLIKKEQAGYPDRCFEFIDSAATYNFLQQRFDRYPAMTCDSFREIFDINCHKRTCAEVQDIFEATAFDLP